MDHRGLARVSCRGVLEKMVYELMFVVGHRVLTFIILRD